MKKFVLSACFALLTLGAAAQSPISFQVKAGVGTAYFGGKNTSVYDTKLAYKVGVGMDYAFSRMWSLQPTLNFVSKGSKGEVESLAKFTMDELYLELPVLLTAHLHVDDRTNFTFAAGPYIAYGIAGTTTADFGSGVSLPTESGSIYVSGEQKINTFGSLDDGYMGGIRFDAGIAFAVGIEYRHFIFGADAQIGLTTVNDVVGDLVNAGSYSERISPKNVSVFFSVGYKF